MSASFYCHSTLSAICRTWRSVRPSEARREKEKPSRVHRATRMPPASPRHWMEVSPTVRVPLAGYTV